MVREYEDLLSYEAWNRYITIDPMLRALGWETHDPRRCMVEWARGKQGNADYALYDPQENIAVLVEAKALGKIAQSSVKQLSRYSLGMRDGIGVLTDGRIWSLYDLAKRGSFQSKIICEELDIVGTNRRRAAVFLDEWLSKDNWW